MRVLVLGGTGTVGSAIVPALLQRGADVAMLVRSPLSAARAEEVGAHPVAGDIAEPAEWRSELGRVDAVVHTANTFGPDMPETDRALLDLFRAELPVGAAVVYTGGVWLYGDCGDRFRDDDGPWDPPPGWQWNAGIAAAVKESPELRGMVVHPGNVVVSGDLPAPRMLVEEARRHEVVRTPVDDDVRWPLVAADDLGDLYARVLDHGTAGLDYLGVSDAGVPVGAIAERLRDALALTATRERLPVDYWRSEYGAWAEGYRLSQQLYARRAIEDLGWAPQWRFSSSVA